MASRRPRQPLRACWPTTVTLRVTHGLLADRRPLTPTPLPLPRTPPCLPQPTHASFASRLAVRMALDGSERTATDVGDLTRRRGARQKAGKCRFKFHSLVKAVQRLKRAAMACEGLYLICRIIGLLTVHDVDAMSSRRCRASHSSWRYLLNQRGGHP
jgi:hypothetical protein